MSDWIEWKGGERPVPPDTLVGVQFRNGETNVAPAKMYWWPHQNRADIRDIIAYHVVSEAPKAETGDWIEHNGGPQPVADDVWICIDAMPEEMEAVGAGYVRLPKQVGSWNQVTGFFVLNQHLIDAARLKGVRLGLEAAEKYNRRAFDLIVDALRNTNPDTIAREAVLDQLTSEAQAEGMGYDKEADQ